MCCGIIRQDMPGSVCVRHTKLPECVQSQTGECINTLTRIVHHCGGRQQTSSAHTHSAQKPRRKAAAAAAHDNIAIYIICTNGAFESFVGCCCVGFVVPVQSGTSESTIRGLHTSKQTNSNTQKTWRTNFAPKAACTQTKIIEIFTATPAGAQVVHCDSRAAGDYSCVYRADVQLRCYFFVSIPLFDCAVGVAAFLILYLSGNANRKSCARLDCIA